MEQSNKSILLVDGMALLFRAFYATAVSNYFMINSKGIPTNGIHGFVKHLFTAIEHFNPSHVVCCWDMGSKTFRTEEFSEYKANRAEAPIELVPQFDLVKDVVDSFDIPNIGLKGYEADDCIGTLAREYSVDHKVIILTGDQDIFQLINQNVSVAIVRKGFGNYDLYNPERLLEEKGITPAQMIDLKALMGDPSDNYPGVKGIGEKTAIKLLLEFGTIEGILDNLSKLTKSQQKKIEDSLEMLHLSHRLARIHCEVPIECSLDQAEYKVNKERALSTFRELEFKGLDRLLG
ncbi:5'-3' exonuclease [Bacillus mesophilus]|uniref:5'-3' exonuclease n=1 Tax=Bacillus mesophilus TaxID=1808955 RepID=A0A6M0QC20_9BACI|nr:5'-3' exonuclease [Bacillus mesophilus]NEY73903.1 5'-3' exonuclease [Bacillus mesophilus]